MAITLFITTSLVAVLLFLIYYVKKERKYWKNKGIYEIETPYFLGCMKQVLFLEKNFGDVFIDQYKHLRSKKLKYGGTFLFAKPVLVVADPEIMKQIMVSNFASFNSHASYVNEEIDPLSVNLFALEGSRWKALRSAFNPAFSTSKIKMMFEIMKTCSKHLDPILKEFALNKTPVDIKDILGRFTTDVIGNVALGLDCNSLQYPDTEFRIHGKKIFDMGRMIFLKEGLLSVLPTKISRILNLKLIDIAAENFFFKVVNDSMKYREENNITAPDFMQLLIQLKNKGGLSRGDDINETKLSTNEITAQAFVFFLGGFETAATTMTMALYELGMNQNIQDNVRNEINDILGGYSQNITYEAIQEMKYLDRVLCETLRRHPPVSTLTRKCLESYKVSGSDLFIEEGTFIRLPIGGVHMDPEYYIDPEKFDPDRFLEENKNKRVPFTYLPFGEGPRICIGSIEGVISDPTMCDNCQ